MFNDALTKPFARVAVVMTEVAVMHIDEVPDLSSILLEMNSIHRAMIMMMKNLKEYKSYMPQSVLADTTDTDDEGTVNPTDVISSRSGGQKSLSHSHSGSSLKGGKSASLTNDAAGAVRNGMALSITKKRISFALVNICDWHAKVQDLGDSFIEFHSKTLTTVLSCFSVTKGISDVFSGDHFLCGYNGIRTVSGHRIAACNAALNIKTQLETNFNLRISSAVVTGEGRVGNLGCDEMKKYSYVTPVLTWCHSLERYARNLDVGVLCDQWVAQDAVSDFSLRDVGKVDFAKRTTKSIKVHILISAKAQGDADEWMYQMEAASKSNPYVQWNKYVTFVCEGDFEV